MRIMFVCLGNICRSPMAEFIFKNMISGTKQEDEFFVSSAATSGENVFGNSGSPIYPPAQRVLKAHNIPFGDKRAVKLEFEDYDKYDLFIGMDTSNIRNMERILKGDKDRKIRKLMDYTSRGGDVSDPWYTGNFDIAFADIEEGCREIIKRYTQGIPL